MKLFVGFVVISGLGWLLDFLVYSVLTQVLQSGPATANVVSSFVGVTYVWIEALNRLFERGHYSRSVYLPVYWGYQSVSILAYSMLISIMSTTSLNDWLAHVLRVPSELTVKVLITPFNLLTNFIFMKLITKFMRPMFQG